MCLEMEPCNVLVTGFGPFRDHSVNASWEAVKLLPNYKIEGVNLHIKEIPVTYKDVEEIVPKLWKDLQPKLVIHVGVSSFTSSIAIEQKAHRNGYTQFDSNNQLHPTGNVCCSTKGKDCIETMLDVDKICNIVNQKSCVKVSVSKNAGRFLCEFIYYTSLNIDCNRTIFIHVPPLKKPYTEQQLAEGLIEIIKCALQQLTCNKIC